MKSYSHYDILVSSLQYVAAPYEEQVEVVPEFVWVGDDVVSTFDQGFGLLPQIVESGVLSFEAIAQILILERQIGRVTTNPELDPIESFKSHPEWNRVREMAGAALRLMGETFGGPVKDNQWLTGKA